MSEFANEVVRHYRGLLKLARSLRGVDPEDLVHDTIVRALRHEAGYVNRGMMYAWLATMMLNLYRNGVRRGYKVAFVPLTSAREPANELVDDGLDDDLLHALGAVSVCYREMVVLCDLLEFSYARAASTVGVPTGTVMSRLYRGRAALRTAYLARRSA